MSRLGLWITQISNQDPVPSGDDSDCIAASKLMFVFSSDILLVFVFLVRESLIRLLSVRFRLLLSVGISFILLVF